MARGTTTKKSRGTSKADSHSAGDSQRTRPKGLLPAVIAAALTLILLMVAGPWPLSVSNDQTGDQEVSQYLSNHAPNGGKDIAAFILETDQNGARKARFGGLGATENSEVEIGSVTKTFTTQLLTQMVRTKEVSLDTTVGEIIDVGDAPIHDVTLKELADHTAGVPRLVGTKPNFLCTFTNCNPYADDLTPQQILDEAKNVKLHKRGERAYSNYGYALLGQLLAHKAGMSYADLLKNNILQPAGMSQTYLATPGTTGGRAQGYAVNGRKTKAWEMNGYAPSGAIRSTPADMAKYAEFVLTNGTAEYGWGDFGFTLNDEPQNLADTDNPQADNEQANPEQSNAEQSGTADPNSPDYAKSLYGKFPYKNGRTAGYSTGMIVDPRNGKAVFVSNRSGVAVNDLTFTLFDTLSKGAI